MMKKEDTETVLNLIKIAYYFAITGGVAWNLAYYGFVVGILPDFDFANLTAYLVATFGIGLFLVIAFVILLLLPGLIIWGALKDEERKEKEGKEEKTEKAKKCFLNRLTIRLFSKGKEKKTEEAEKGIKLTLKSWLEQERCEKWKICNSHLLYILPSIGIFISSFLAWLCPEYGSGIIVAGLILLGIWLLIQKVSYKGSLFWSVILFLFMPAMIAIRFTSMVQTSDSGGIGMALFTFAMILIFASFLNRQVAIKGLGFAEITENYYLNTIISGWLLVLIIILFFSNIVGITKEPNPFLTAPYKVLKIGQVPAKLTLDKDYIKDAQLRERGLIPDSSCQTTFKFKILSSIGTEYIVQYPADSSGKDINKNFPSEAKNVESMTLRISKTKVLLVEYK